MTLSTLMKLAGLALLAAGCASTTAAERVERRALADTCPMKVKGAKVVAVNVEGGAAIDFTCDPVDVAELRGRTLRMAGLHNDHHEDGMKLIAARASIADIEGGERLILRPTDLGQLEALREEVRKGAERMNRGVCPMMSGGHSLTVANAAP